jgi:hypothetical protein
MAIATFDLASAGARPPIQLAKAISPTLVVGRPHSTWPLAGTPGAGAFDTTLNGVTLSNATVGSINKGNPVSGNAYLLRASGQALAAGRLLVYDRLWHNGGYTITSTSAQNSTTPTWPSRCPTSATDDTPGTTGFGIHLALEVSAATGAGTPTITIGYTNEAGTASRSATNLLATVATSAIGAWYPIGLQAGDKGVRSVQSTTLSATWTSGTMNLVAYRPVGEIICGPAGDINWLTGGAPRIYDSSCLFLVWVPTATTATHIQGLFQETHG